MRILMTVTSNCRERVISRSQAFPNAPNDEASECPRRGRVFCWLEDTTTNWEYNELGAD